MGAGSICNPHFHMEIVKIDGYYKAFCQNRWAQLYPLTLSNEGPDLSAYLLPLL